MGSPVSGRVLLFCALDRNEGFFRSSILSCFAMGSPCGSGVFFRTLDRIEACFGLLFGIPSGWGPTVGLDLLI